MHWAAVEDKMTLVGALAAAGAKSDQLTIDGLATNALQSTGLCRVYQYSDPLAAFPGASLYLTLSVSPPIPHSPSSDLVNLYWREHGGGGTVTAHHPCPKKDIYVSEMIPYGD